MFRTRDEELAHIASLTDLEVCTEYNTNSRKEAEIVTNEYWDYYEEDEEDFDDDTFFREKEQEYRFNNQRRYAI